MLELFIPETGKNGNCKDLVVSVLTKAWPLSLKEIHNRVKKNFKYSGSYQSVFKAVNELLKKKVLVRRGNTYEINVSWIKNLQSWTDFVETNYYADRKGDESGSASREGDVVVMNFNSIFDAEKYLYYFIKSELKKMKNKEVVYEINNLWKVLFYYRAEYNYYTKLMGLGHKFYFSIKTGGEIEKQGKDFYKKIGVNVCENKNLNIIDSVTFGDYFIQIFIPEELNKKISKHLSSGDSLSLLKVLDEEANIKIIKHKDSQLSKNVLEKIIRKN